MSKNSCSELVINTNEEKKCSAEIEGAFRGTAVRWRENRDTGLRNNNRTQQKTSTSCIRVELTPYTTAKVRKDTTSMALQGEPGESRG